MAQRTSTPVAGWASAEDFLPPEILLTCGHRWLRLYHRHQPLPSMWWPDLSTTRGSSVVSLLHCECWSEPWPLEEAA